MALAALHEDEQRIICTQLCSTLEPRLAVYFSSASRELRELTQALLQQLRADHKMAAALCVKLGLRCCKELREARRVVSVQHTGLSTADLALLGTLGSVLPALETLSLSILHASGPHGVQRLAEGLGAGALPTMTMLTIEHVCVGDAGASAIASALGRGALPRLKTLDLYDNAISDAELVVLAPALRQRFALECLILTDNPFSDEGLAALVAPPLPAGAPPALKGVLTKLKELNLSCTKVSDAGCAILAAALNSGALPALQKLNLEGTPASAAARAAVFEVRDTLDNEGWSGSELGSESEEEEEDDTEAV